MLETLKSLKDIAAASLVNEHQKKRLDNDVLEEVEFYLEI